MDHRRAGHGSRRKNFTQRSQRSLRGHSKFTGWRGLWLNGRPTRWARLAEEDFHTEVAKIAKGHSKFTSWRGPLAKWTIDALGTAGRRRFSHRGRKDR